MDKNLHLFTNILNFIPTIVEKISYMVDNIIKKVDFLLAVFISIVFYAQTSYAQTAEDYMVIDILTREDGLPDQDINGLYFDSTGFAWISTFGGGVVRYDGDSFLKFSSKNDPEFPGRQLRQVMDPHCGPGHNGHENIHPSGRYARDVQGLAQIAFPVISQTRLRRMYLVHF